MDAHLKRAVIKGNRFWSSGAFFGDIVFFQKPEVDFEQANWVFNLVSKFIDTKWYNFNGNTHFF